VPVPEDASLTAAPRFGEQRLYRPGAVQRLLFRAMGVADPGHYLHHRYVRWGLSFLPAAPARILDAGCGAGDHSFYLARRFPAAQVLGVDVDAARVARCSDAARRMGVANARFEVGDLTQLGHREAFDLVVSVDVLEHIVEQERAVGALRDALTPGGRFFFHIPTKRPKPVPFDRYLGAFHAWAAGEHVAEDRTAEEFVAVVRAAGLTVEEHRRTFGYYTGELATSLFNLPRAKSGLNQALQALLAPLCRALVLADTLEPQATRYAVAVVGRRSGTG
jgi:SAM-dependent methyltransferase